MLSRRGFVCGAAAAMAGAAAAPLVAAPLAKIRALGVMRIAVYRDFAPWAAEREGRLVGIDVDIGKLIASKLGVRGEAIQYIADESVDDDLRNMVWRGSLLGQAPGDVMMHVPYDRVLGQRNDRAVLIAPYYRESFAMVCNRATTDCEVPPPQLKGKKLVAELDSIPDFYLSGSFGGVLRGDVKNKLSGEAAVAAVAAGEADAAVATRAQVEAGMKAAGDRLTLRKGPLPAMTSPGWNVGMAVKDDSRDLGDEIERIMEGLAKSGELAGVFAAHGVEYRPPLLT